MPPRRIERRTFAWLDFTIAVFWLDHRYLTYKCNALPLSYKGLYTQWR